VTVFDREGMKELYIFKHPTDPHCPMVLHFVLVNIDFRDFKEPGMYSFNTHVYTEHTKVYLLFISMFIQVISLLSENVKKCLKNKEGISKAVNPGKGT